MDNIIIRRKGDILTLEIDISKTIGLSNSDKTLIVASTRGNITLPGLEDYGFRLGATLFRYIGDVKEYIPEVPKAMQKKRVSRRTLNVKNKKSKAFISKQK